MSESNTRVEIIETMANGICDAIDADGLVRPEYAASAALTALEASGRVVVPREPTEAMKAAGDLSMADGRWDGPATCWDWMIDAILKEEGNG